ncbi:MAG: transglutaminase-like domain-containing protein [Coriobacteriales bacterium]|nr:transglutaminase-like domain-containing protein [Coriobacteriales bacterium]
MLYGGEYSKARWGRLKSKWLLLLCLCCLGVSALGFSACTLFSDRDQANKDGASGKWKAPSKVMQAKAPGNKVIEQGGVVMDYSNTKDGYFCVKSKLGATLVKVLVDVGGRQYQYSLVRGSYNTIPLTCGDNLYQVGVWRRVRGTTYAGVFAHNLEVRLKNPYSAFLYPNQYIDFRAGDRSTLLSRSLSRGQRSELAALGRIYGYVVDHIDYDYSKARTVPAGYLPNNTTTLATKKGICFDYASLTAAMLRVQGIPAKMVVGYAGSAYHAWLQVLCQATGEVRDYRFDGHSWVRMDPTFNATSKDVEGIAALVGNGSNYAPIFYY